MKRVLIALAIVALAVGAAGCGSKKKSSSSSTTAAGSSQNSSSSSSSSSSCSSSGSGSSSSSSSTKSFTSVKNCADLKGLSTKLSQSVSANLASGNYDAIEKTYSQLADAAPSEIRGDLKT